MPEVTVLMPVRNAGQFIRDAINSVLRQSYTNFELLIIDDGSTDNTVEIVREYRDPRIRLEMREHHFIDNLNEGIRIAKGKYIARMDADDIMHSERLRIQVQRMEEMPEITVCSTWMKIFGEHRITEIIRSLSGKVDKPLEALLEKNVFSHPTIMMRKEFLEKNRLGYKNYTRSEDYKLWADIACYGGQFYVEPQPLLFYRISPQQFSMQGERAGKKIRQEIKELLQETRANNSRKLKTEARNLL